MILFVPKRPSVSGVADWTYVVDFADAILSEAGNNDFVFYNTLTLPGGIVSKLKMKSGEIFTLTVGCKLALYDSSDNIVGATTDYPAISIDAANTEYECVLINPQTISGGTYKVAFMLQSADVSIRHRTVGATHRRDAGDNSYASFPSSTISTFFNDTLDYALGVYITS